MKYNLSNQYSNKKSNFIQKINKKMFLYNLMN